MDSRMKDAFERARKARDAKALQKLAKSNEKLAKAQRYANALKEEELILQGWKRSQETGELMPPGKLPETPAAPDGLTQVASDAVWRAICNQNGNWFFRGALNSGYGETQEKTCLRDFHARGLLERRGNPPRVSYRQTPNTA